MLHRVRWPAARAASLFSALLCCVLSLAVARTALAADAQVTVNRFSSLPARLSYFEDTSVVLYHDAMQGVVWRSEDEGKSWNFVDGVKKGSAWMLVEHPYDNRAAYILSNGKTHWRTTNRGKTWQEFSTPDPPASRMGAPLEFHASPNHWEWIIYTGKKCNMWTPWSSAICHDQAYYTHDAFASDVKPLVEYVQHCSWAKASKEIVVAPEYEKRIFCIAWEDVPGHATRSTVYDDPNHMLQSHAARGEHHMSAKRAGGSATRMFYSDDFFESRRLVEFDMGRDAKGFIGLGPSKKYLVTALRDAQSGGAGGSGDEMTMFVSIDGNEWSKARFPHGHGLRENAYTVVDSTLHSLVVDVLDGAGSQTGVLFTSDSTGTQFVKSLEGTNRNRDGIVDFEHLTGIEGVGLANTIGNAADMSGEEKFVKTMITFDDGSRWNFLQAPDTDVDGKRVHCDTSDLKRCSLHLYSVTTMHNTGSVFSSTAPGFVMGVGSIGDRLLPYEECDTFLSVDAGVTWRMVSKDAHKYEFGDQGSILVIVDDEDSTDHVSYSYDQGKSWNKVNLGVKMRAKILTTIPDNTSQKFLLIGTQTRKESGGEPRHVAAFIDFATMGKRKCGDNDFEKWYARTAATNGPACLMGHRQSYKRRKADADCYVGDKFQDPVSKNEPCPCTEEDYECDFNFVRDVKGVCVPAGPETIPAGSCVHDWEESYEGSSGYRKIPGNTCEKADGVKLDDKVKRPCSKGKPAPGEVSHQRHEFPGLVIDHMYFGDSHNVVVQSSDGSIWESNNDGYSWKELQPSGNPNDKNERFLAMAMHGYNKERGYLITSGQKVLYSTNRGIHWDFFTAPLEANGLGISILDFHPTRSDWLIWTGSVNCVSSISTDCRAEAWYSTNHGRDWYLIDSYVRTCSWARDARFKVNERLIYCESYADKRGSQKAFDSSNKIELIAGLAGERSFSRTQKLFSNIIGFATFEEYLVVAELVESSSTLKLQISLNGRDFAEANFPPNMHIENRAYTVLDSVTDSIFLHVTTHSTPGSEWGTLFKSDSNGTHYSMSLEYVNRNDKGYVDFEKMLGLDGIALMNVISNPDTASVTGTKELQTRITHNDGGRWKPLTPPARDAFGAPYECHQAGCDLHLHGYTERDDPRATYSSPSAVGLMLGVGSVGKKLASYTDSDTFLTRDGGFTWEEVHKDAHKWEFGDQGSIIILVNDEEPTDTVLYSLDEGLTWKEYNFGERIRVTSIVTVPEDTHRRFILFGAAPRAQAKSIAIHLDFSSLSSRKCKLDPQKPGDDDFELWSPSEERVESCLFGRQTYYYRRKRSADCFIGEQIVQPHEIVKNCTCTRQDFECEFNHYLDLKTNECVLYPGATVLADDISGQCSGNVDYWYERTNMRRVPYSSCEGGERLDRGERHVCPNSIRRHGFFWWATIILCPFALAGLFAFWWMRKGVDGRAGSIRLPDPNAYSDSSVMQTLASVPWFVVGVANALWGRLVEMVEDIPVIRDRLRRSRGSYGGYRTLSTDEDAEILRDYEEEEPER